MDICKHNADCGGCIYQETPYEDQMALKAKTVQRLVEEKGAFPRRFLGVEGSPQRYGYRNKMEYTFGDEVKDGEMTLGMHKKGRFMSIITVDECQLAPPDFNKILRATLDFCTDRGYNFYHKKAHKGLLRNLVLRCGVNTGELLVNIVTTSQGEFDGQAYVKCLEALDLDHELAGTLQTYNDGLSDAVNCDRLKILKGRDYYMEEIMGLKFKVSAFSFFQTNVAAVEKLYAEAISFIDDVEGKVVFDLYCGTGTIAQSLALRAKEAIGVEIVEEAVEAARENAARNGLKNCKFIAGDVLAVLDSLEERPDVIVVDPPRAGIHPKALQKILNYGVEQILYISCNPKSLAENLEMMKFAGYTVDTLKVFDNFPFTKHVETAVLLVRKP